MLVRKAYLKAQCQIPLLNCKLLIETRDGIEPLHNVYTYARANIIHLYNYVVQQRVSLQQI